MPVKNSSNDYDPGPGQGNRACGGGCPGCAAKSAAGPSPSTMSSPAVMQAHQVLQGIKNGLPTQRIWEKCCVNLWVLPVQTVDTTDLQVLDESPNNVPTVEETDLFAAAGASTCIQVFIPQTFEQAGKIDKDISGGGATYDSGTANPEVVVVEGAVPEVIAHEVGQAMSAIHDNADTIMKPTGKHNVAGSRKVSPGVCTEVRAGVVLSKTSGKAECCMFPN